MAELENGDGSETFQDENVNEFDAEEAQLLEGGDGEGETAVADESATEDPVKFYIYHLTLQALEISSQGHNWFQLIWKMAKPLRGRSLAYP